MRHVRNWFWWHAFPTHGTLPDVPYNLLEEANFGQLVT